jgi:hypothetical protein
MQPKVEPVAAVVFPYQLRQSRANKTKDTFAQHPALKGKNKNFREFLYKS